jgi:hypothetical protein
MSTSAVIKEERKIRGLGSPHRNTRSNNISLRFHIGNFGQVSPWYRISIKKWFNQPAELEIYKL